MLLVLVSISALSCLNESESYPGSPVERLLHQEEIKILLAKYSNTLLVAESGYCQPGVCERLLAGEIGQIDLKVYSKEEMFMRNIPDYIEIIEVSEDHLKVILYGRNERQSIEIN